MTVMDFPSSPINGQTTTDGRYYFDSSVGSTGAWRSTPLPVGGLPAGSIMAWGTNTPPANWLLADGSAVSRSVYSSLFAVIGTTYGTGDGSTTFNLPDLRGRVPVGRNGGTFGTLGATGGAETVTLDATQIPAHSHPNTLTSNTVASSSHRHSVAFSLGDWNYSPSGGNAGMGDTSGSGGGIYDYALGKYVGPNGGARTGYNNWNVHSDGVTGWQAGTYFTSEGKSNVNDATTTVGITNANNTGGGSAHNNLQPYQVVNYIIKTSAGWTAGDSELATRVGAIETTTVRSVALGGTGAATLTSGGYLKGNGTSAITSQTGIPAGDITSGALGVAYGGTGNTVGAGLNPIVPSSLVVAGGSASAGSTGRVSFTNITNLGLRDVFTSSSYTNFHVVLTISGVSAAVGDFYLRLGNSGTAETTANYQYQAMRGYASTVAATGGSTSAIWGGQAWAIDANADRPANGTYTIGNPNQSKRTSFTGNVGYDNGYNIVTHTLFGTHNISTSYSDLFIYPSGNSFSGNIQVFGYR